jgi:tetratricopeptide (TPR) repeat protein
MKTIILLALSLSLRMTVFGQAPEKLLNNNWIKVIEENINDSIILYGEDVSDLYMKLVFNKKDTLTLFGNPDGGIEYGYKLSDNLLTLTDSSYYIINKLNDSMLVLLSGITEKDLLQRKRMIFMEENYLFNKLLKSGKIEVINDSIILSNKIIYPTFKISSFYMFLNWYLPAYKAEKENGIISFRLIFSPDGHLIKCTIIYNEKLSRSFAEKVRELVTHSSGLWALPGIKDKYYYDLVMCIWFPTKKESLLKLAYPSYFDNNCKPLLRNQILAMKKHLETGLQLIEEGKYGRSIEEFNNCLSLNPNHPENIYYNRAYAYYKLNKISEACSDWNLLVNKGQQYAKKLHSTFCR